MQKDDLKKQAGFTLVELIVALTLLLVVALAFVPMFVYVSEGSQNNRARLIAIKLASSKIEEIRALPYDQVGTYDKVTNVPGAVPGVIPQEEIEEVDGIEFTIKTTVAWEDDPYDGTVDTGDVLPSDYKTVKVVVSSPSIFTGEVVETAKIDTLASMEGEEEAYPGGNIRGFVQRGWQTGSEPKMVENARIELLKDSSLLRTGLTDKTGKILFAVLDEGYYNIYVIPPSGMMTKTGQGGQEVEVVEGTTKTVTFEVEYPCHLSLKLFDSKTEDPINSTGTITLRSPVTSDISINFTDSEIPATVFGDIWPIGEGASGVKYDLEVLANGYLPFKLSELSDPDKIWDGTFAAPGETKEIQIGLEPANAQVKVVDEGNEDITIAGAVVKISRHTFRYNGDSWVGECKYVTKGTTSENGIAAFNLIGCAPKSETPQENDEYFSYCVEVEKDGYQPYPLQHDAFWVNTIGQQMEGAEAVAFHTVHMEAEEQVPSSISISVLVMGWNFSWTGMYWGPIKDVTVKVEQVGNAEINKTAVTNKDGIAFFEGLQPGNYKVYISYFLGWRERGTVDATGGNGYIEVNY